MTLDFVGDIVSSPIAIQGVLEEINDKGLNASPEDLGGRAILDGEGNLVGIVFGEEPDPAPTS